MRLIDADALKETICTNVYPIRDIINSQDYGMFWTGGIEKAIDDAPTIDAEPIIRCKDCKYFMYGNGCILQGVDYSWEEQMYADDFCSRGERKDEID